MKRIFAVLGGLGTVTAYIALAGIPAFGDQHEGPVTTTVTVQVPPPCITVAISEVNYGELPFREEGGGASAGSSDPFNVTNCGSEDANILVRSSNFTNGGHIWTLREASQCSGDDFVQNQASHRIEGTGLSQRALTNSDQQIFGGLAPNASRDAFLILHMPCEGSDGFGETFTATVTFTAERVPD